MTRDDKIKAFTMRLDGKTFQEIGDEFGVSKQCIEQMLGFHQRKARTSIAVKCIYKGLAGYLQEEKISIAKMTELLEAKTPYIVSKKLSGEKEFKISEIKKILQITGQTFEECFEEKETPGAATPRESR